MIDRVEMAIQPPRATSTRFARHYRSGFWGPAVPERPFSVARYTEPINSSAPFSADRLIVAPAAYVDMDTAPLLGAALTNALDRHPDVCCDLAAVDFFSAAGVHVLLLAADRAKRGGSRFSIRGAGGITQRVLRITQVEHLFERIASCCEAVKTGSGPAWHPADATQDRRGVSRPYRSGSAVGRCCCR
ncbi:STAS domain-containing protein [Micromonospora sp. NPDC049580]|uniref:STAS domain-containing protein n=1 Tax=unclassified Micromonospora TaxID=2617518 RepID=UPI0033B14FC9